MLDAAPAGRYAQLVSTEVRRDSTSLPSTDVAGARAVFVTTHWSLVLAAGRENSGQAEQALSTLCQTYWYPLYAFVRRRGHGPEDARDLTQEFFARLLRQHWLGQADPRRGRFRTFLLRAMSHFLANEWDKVRAQKRGGSVEFVPLQLDSAETRYGKEPADNFTPEQAFERRWAVALLNRVLQRLQGEWEKEGKGGVFERLKPCLTGEAEQQPYAELASLLGTSEAAVKVAVHRARQQYRRLLREEIGHTVANPAEVDQEMRHLFSTLARR